MPFVGREQDLETVGRSFQEATQGKGSVVFITGEAGIGKTTFINEFKARYVDARNAASKNKKTPDIRFAEAKCPDFTSSGRGEPYAPFTEIISSLVAGDKSNKMAEIAREVGPDWFEYVPVIGKALKLVSKTLLTWQGTDTARELVDRTGKKEKFVQQYVQTMKLMSEKHPLVLFVDDLHWADDSSIYLLFQLAREIQDRRILILGTYRPTDIQAARGEKAHPLKDALGEIHRFGVCKEVKLGYFTPDHIRRYLDAVFPQNRLDAAFVAYLHDLTEGNPLFVTEQVKLLQEIGKIAPAQTSEVSKTSEVSVPVWELRGTLRDADMPIPTSVEKTIEKRFERLKEELQETLQYASVSGESFDAAVLAQMLQRDELALLKQLQTLDRVYEFVREQKTDDRPARGSVYQFIHSLVQKALYGTLSDGIKVKLHAKAAEIIESLYPEQREAFAEELAAHWERGREYAKAAPYLLLAARKANRQSGYQEAKTHAQRGLDALKSAGFSAIETRDGRTPHVETHGRASLPGTPDQAALRVQIELLIELATAEEAIGETKNSIDHAEGAAKLVNTVDEQGFQGEVFYQIGKVLGLNKTTDLNRVITYLEKALTTYSTIKANEFVVTVLETMYKPYWSLGKGDTFIAHCQEIIRLNYQEQQLNIKILKLIARMFYEQGRHHEAYQNVLEGLTIATKIENSTEQIELLQFLVEYAIRLNDTSKAIGHYANAKIILEKLNEPENKDVIFYKLGDMAFYLGKYEEGIRYCETAREIAHKRGDLELETMILSLLIYRMRDQRMFEKTLKYQMERLEILQKLGRVNEIMFAFKTIGLTFRHQGQHEKAIEMYQQSESLARRYGRGRNLSDCLITYNIELRMIGKFQEAITKISEAVTINQKINDTIQEIYILSNLAISHLLLGHIEESLFAIDKAVNLHQMTQAKITSILLWLHHSYILTGVSKFKEAHVILESTIEDAIKRDTYSGDIHIYLINSAKIYLMFNEPVKSLERLQQIEEFFKRKISIWEATAMLKDAYAQVYLAQGDLEQATASVNEAIALFQQMNSFRLGEAYLTLAAIELAQRQPAAALQHAVDAGNIFKAIEYYRYGETVLMEARAHFALKQYADMQTRLKAAAAEFKRLQQPHHLAEAQLLHGQMLAAAGQPEKALQNMISAKKTFAKLGLKRLENEAERLISRITHTKESREKGE